MLVTKQRNAVGADINIGEFNDCEHLFVQLDPGKNQTISCLLPNGKFVTFAFVAGQGEEFECCDIHSTVGNHWVDDGTVGKHHYQQHLVGFSKKGNTFDTRSSKTRTSLATLLLNKTYYE